MSDGNGSVVSVKILPNGSGTPKGKLADAEVVFGAECGPFGGLRLIGFGVWERRDGGRSVTFPARQYEVNGTRRTFILLRSVTGDEGAYEAIRQTILDAYTRTERPAS
jgi:hypothetical protein